MRTVSRLVGALGAVVCLGAAVVMTAATFLPYTGGNWGDGLLADGEAATTVTVNIISGSDVWLVLGTIVALGFVAAFHLAGVRRQTSAFIALAISLVALGMALKLPETWMQDGVVYGEPYLLFSGFYAFLGGAAAAVLGGLLMVVTDSVGLHAKVVAPPAASPS